LPHEQAGEVGSRIDNTDTGDLAVGKAGNARGITEATAAGELGIDYRFG